MLAAAPIDRVNVRQVMGVTPEVLSRALDDDINLAIWRRRLPAHIEDFSALVLSMNQPLAESITLDVEGGDVEPNLSGLATGYADLHGYEGFIADLSWLVSAYACLLGANSVGLRLRALDKAMCPRFHVDHVPMRLITTYAGVGSQWLKEDAIDRQRLGEVGAEPQDPRFIEQIECGDVALLKGERWRGNEGHGLVHRSPQLAGNERRLILTLDWLA
jgi:hypothetical protein